MSGQQSSGSVQAAVGLPVAPTAPRRRYQLPTPLPRSSPKLQLSGIRQRTEIARPTRWWQGPTTYIGGDAVITPTTNGQPPLTSVRERVGVAPSATRGGP